MKSKPNWSQIRYNSSVKKCHEIGHKCQWFDLMKENKSIYLQQTRNWSWTAFAKMERPWGILKRELHIVFGFFFSLKMLHFFCPGWGGRGVFFNDYSNGLYSNKMYFFLFLHENTWLLITTASVGDSYNSYPYYNMLFCWEIGEYLSGNPF